MAFMVSWVATVKHVSVRAFAVFVSSAFAIIGGSALIAPELELWKSAVLAGFAAVVQVVQRLAQAAIDGTLTPEEIDAAFGVRKDE
jgi:ABC-type uncharacterized transport system permease subunit